MKRKKFYVLSVPEWLPTSFLMKKKGFLDEFLDFVIFVEFLLMFWMNFMILNGFGVNIVICEFLFDEFCGEWN